MLCFFGFFTFYLNFQSINVFLNEKGNTNLIQMPEFPCSCNSSLSSDMKELSLLSGGLSSIFQLLSIWLCHVNLPIVWVQASQ